MLNRRFWTFSRADGLSADRQHGQQSQRQNLKSLHSFSLNLKKQKLILNEHNNLMWIKGWIVAQSNHLTCLDSRVEGKKQWQSLVYIDRYIFWLYHWLHPLQLKKTLIRIGLGNLGICSNRCWRLSKHTLSWTSQKKVINKSRVQLSTSLKLKL